MGDESFRFGGGSTSSHMHPVVMVAMLVVMVMVLFAPRKRLIVPLLSVALFTPFVQELYIGGFHFFALRLVVLTGCVRLLVARVRLKEVIFTGGFNSIDKAFCFFSLCGAAAFMLLYRETGAVVYQTAGLIDGLGGYFLLRYVIQDEEDIFKSARLLASVTVVMAICMANERFRHLNVFGYFGGSSMVPDVRDGQIRARGAFGHPVLAGAFGATVVPLFFWLCKSGRSRIIALAGFAGSTVMVLASASSTPVMAYAAAIGGLFLWPIRAYMRQVRWGIVLALMGASLVMKAPVWFVISHLDVVGNSSGWHRAQLVDVFIRHFGDWWALGARDNESWGSETIDTSNQFIAVGVSGGLVAFIWFIVIIRRGFGTLGTERRLAAVAGDRDRQWFLWSLCAVMLAHIVAFWGTAYWDQTAFWWRAFLAMISVAVIPIQSSGQAVGQEARATISETRWETNPDFLPPGSRNDDQPALTY